MDKNEKVIMAIKRDNLFKNDDFEGFKPASEVNFYERLLKDRIKMKRGDAEKDPNYKQPIAYALIISPSGKVFAYQRSKKDKDYGEKRLQGKWSWGIGGHIDEIDMQYNDPINASLMRELKEEVGIDCPNVNLNGYINYDTDSVDQVHFGLLYIVKINSEEISPKDQEIAQGRLHTISEVERICSSDAEVETWSRTALDPLKSYLKSQDIPNLKHLTPLELSEHKVYD